MVNPRKMLEIKGYQMNLLRDRQRAGTVDTETNLNYFLSRYINPKREVPSISFIGGGWVDVVLNHKEVHFIGRGVI